MDRQNFSGFTAIRPLLLRIGMHEKEVEVYLALLSLKVGRASSIAKAAKITRSHTYLILRELEAKGLVAEVERGNIIHFIAEPPGRLRQYVEERERELRSLKPLIEGALPLLSSLTKPLMGTPRVTMLHGEEGMRQIYRDGLNQEICGLFNPAAMYEAFGGNIVTMLLGNQKPLRGRDLIVQSPATKRYLKEVPPHENYLVRLLPKGTSFDSDTMIIGDTVALFAYDDEKTIVRIENANVAAAFRAWFEILWRASSPPQPV